MFRQLIITNFQKEGIGIVNITVRPGTEDFLICSAQFFVVLVKLVVV